MAFQGLLLLYSGGVGNSDPAGSLGGQVSLVSPERYVSPQKIISFGGIPGVIPCVCKGSQLGTAWLIYHHDDNSLTWILPGTVSTQSPAGPAPLLLQTLNMPENQYPPERYSVSLDGSGYYELGGGSKSLLVSVNASALPTTRTIVQLTIEDNKHNIFDAITQGESNSGLIEYRCLYIQNLLSDPISLKLTITSQPANSIIMVANEFALSGLAEAEMNGSVDSGLWLLGEGVNYTATMDPMYEDMGMFLLHGSAGAVMSYQSTDGLTGDLPVQLVDESDSTDLTQLFKWSTDAVFSTMIPSGKMVSVWFKRVKPAAVTTGTEDTFQFQILYESEVLTTPWELNSTNFMTLPTVVTIPATAAGMTHKAGIESEDGTGVVLLEGEAGVVCLEEVNYG